MARLLIATTVLLGLLVLIEWTLHVRQEAHRTQASTLRLLSGSRNLSVGRVTQVQIAQGETGTPWTYRRHNGTWRYPATFNAYVQADRIVRLLGGILQSLGTIASTDPGAAAHYGLSPEQALLVRLRGTTDAERLEVWIGRSVPGRDTGESYMKAADSDTIYHMHTDPRLALQPVIPGKPPMVDPYVLPRALSRKPIVRITFGHPPRTLRRQGVKPAAPQFPGRPPEGPTYAWRLDKEEQACNAASVYAFTGYLTRLRYEELHAPHATGMNYGFSPGGSKLHLEDVGGVVDTLEIGGKEASGNVFLHHRTTGQVFTITSRKADLLFPTVQALLDTLPRPSPYDLAEPPAPFSLR